MTRSSGWVWTALAVAFVLAGLAPARGEENQPQAPDPNQAAGTKVTVEPGNGVTFSSADGNYTLNLGFFGQFRGQYLDRDEFRRADTNPSLPYRVENIGVQEPSFRVRRVRPILSGNVFRTWMSYKIQLELADNDEGLREVF